MGQITGRCRDVGLAHVHCNRPAVQIEHDRHVSMAAANTDLIDGDSLETLQRRTTELLLQKSLLDLFDRLPTDSQVVGNILDRRVPGKLKHVPLESPGVSPMRICKGNFHLPNHSTVQTKNSLNQQLDQGRTHTYGQRIPHAPDRAFLLHCSTSTMRTRKRCRILVDSENGAALLESRMYMMDSPSHNSKTVIQYTRGHDSLAFSDSSITKECRKSCPTFIDNPGTTLREEPDFSLKGLGTVLELSVVTSDNSYDGLSQSRHSPTRTSCQARFTWSGSGACLRTTERKCCFHCRSSCRCRRRH